MIAGKFAELILEALGKNDQDFKIDRRVVLAMAEVVAGGFLSQYVKAGEQIPGGYFVPYIFPYQDDTQRKRKFILPAPGFMELADGAGIQSIGPIEDDTTAYVAMKIGQLAAIKPLEINTLVGQTGYWPERNKIYFHQVPLFSKEALVRMIPKISEVEEEEEIFSSDEVQDRVLTAVIDRLRLKLQIPEDKSDENVSSPK